MKNIFVILFLGSIFPLFSLNHSNSNNIQDTHLSSLPGRIKSTNVYWMQFGSTDVYFYMTPEKYALTKKIVDEINQEKIKLTVDINNYDCLTTELSAIASKYPDPIQDSEGKACFYDLTGHTTLEDYAADLKNLISQTLSLNMEGVSREINFIVNQDAHKFHQDQSAKQFEYLNDNPPSSKPTKIIQDLTLVDWDMSVDTFSATIVQDSVSQDRFLLPLFPKEIVGMLFTQSPNYLTWEAHPSYGVPTIFPYHAVLSPIDFKSQTTPGSSKGKRLSTVLRGIVSEDELEKLKAKAICLSLTRSSSFKDEQGEGLIYPNGIIVRRIPKDIKTDLDRWEEGWVYKYADRENIEVIELNSPISSYATEFLAKSFGININEIKKVSFLRLTKREGGFSSLKFIKELKPNSSDIILLNSSIMPKDYDYFNLAQDYTGDQLPWIQLYHFSGDQAFWVPDSVVSKLSLTPIEEILFRNAEKDSFKTDGLISIDKIITKLDVIIFERAPK